METLNSSTLSEKMLNEGKVHCYECKVGYYKPLTPNCKKKIIALYAITAEID